MNFDQYQAEALRTANTSRDKHQRILIALLGLAGESGEACDLVKKFYEQGRPYELQALARELGDVLWYVAEAASAHGLSLQDIAQVNVAKLRARYPDGFSTEASQNRKPDDT